MAFRLVVRPVYDGVIAALMATGAYRLANLVFIVIWPAFSVVAAVWAAWKVLSGQIFSRKS